MHFFFFPFLAHGHMIPITDMAKIFAARGVKATIITTPLNALFFSKSIEKSTNSGLEISIKTIKFPSLQAGLPPGYENLDSLISDSDETFKEMTINFFKAATMLQEPLEQLLQEHHPDCIVADMFFPWATDVAAKLGIPRLFFHGSGFFPLCITQCLRQYQPHKKVESDSEPFVVPNLPDEIKLTRMQLPDFMKADNDFAKVLNEVDESELRSYGVVFNSFYELEPAYADFYRNVMGRRAWHIGPLSLCNKDIEDKAQRGGKEVIIGEQECLRWLDSKKPNSVVYICFGSMPNFAAAQFMEIAMALEASGHQFIWVVRKNKKDVEEKEDQDWLPEGFEKRMEGKGLIIRGWAPQVFILDHEAVGGFVTHCGWNSTLEGVAAGVPMVTWPLFAEQFYNEKLVTEVLKIGVGVGVKQWSRLERELVKKEDVEKGVRRVMVGEEAEGMRSRAKALGEMARKAWEEGGSSYSDLDALLKEMKLHRH